MSMASSSHFIFPTYTSTLNLAIQTVVQRFNEGSNIGAWIALQSLYRILVPPLRKEVQQEYENILQQIAKAQKRTRHSDPLAEQANLSKEIERVCRQNNGIFFENIINILYSKGYLERLPRKILTSVEPGITLPQASQ